MNSGLSVAQIDYIKNELDRRRLLLDKRLDALAEKKRAKKKTHSATPNASTNVTQNGTRVSTRGSSGRPRKAKKTPTNQQAIQAARKLGATDEMLKQMGLLL